MAIPQVDLPESPAEKLAGAFVDQINAVAGAIARSRMFEAPIPFPGNPENDPQPFTFTVQTPLEPEGDYLLASVRIELATGYIENADLNADGTSALLRNGQEFTLPLTVTALMKPDDKILPEVALYDAHYEGRALKIKDYAKPLLSIFDERVATVERLQKDLQAGVTTYQQQNDERYSKIDQRLTQLDNGGTVTEPTPEGQYVNEFWAVDATGQELFQITEGYEIDIVAYPKLHIVAKPVPSVVGCVDFALSGAMKWLQTENGDPYSLKGDSNGEVYAIDAVVGESTLTAIPYTERDKKGTKGAGKTVNFKVINSTPVPVKSKFQFRIPTSYVTGAFASSGIPAWMTANKIPTFGYLGNASPFVLDNADGTFKIKKLATEGYSVESWCRDYGGMPNATDSAYVLVDLEGKWYDAITKNAKGTPEFVAGMARFVALRNAFKEVRPNCKVAFYGLPFRALNQAAMDLYNGTTHDKYDEILSLCDWTTISLYPYYADAQTAWSGGHQGNLDYLKGMMREALFYKAKFGTEVYVYMHERYHDYNTGSKYGYNKTIFDATGFNVSYKNLWVRYEWMEEMFTLFASYVSPDNGLSVNGSVWWTDGSATIRKSRPWGDDGYLQMPIASDFADVSNTDVSDKVLLTQEEHDARYYQMITRAFGACGVSYL